MVNENSNKKLMFITVGVGGTNGEDIAHALFYTIKHCNPDVVVFLASNESWDKVSFHLLPNLENWRKNLVVEKKIIGEIDDFEFLHNEFSRIIRSYFKKGYQKENSIADYTSGTKAMSAAIVSSAILNKIDTLTYVTGKREKGRVVSGTERQYPLSTSSIISKQTIEEAVKYFNKGMFSTVIQMLSSSLIHPEHKITSETIIKLGKFFDYWDKFDFKQAFEIIKNINEDSLKELKLSGKLKKLRDNILHHLIQGELNLYKVDDLLFNAGRRAAEGKFDDAVARIYRAVEMLGQIEFQKEFNCTTSKIIIENFEEYLVDSIKKLCPENERGERQSGLFQTFKILSFASNRYGKLFMDNFSEIRKLMDSRNFSILAHGINPVSEKTFSKFYSFITETFELADKGNRNPNFSFPKIELEI